MTLVFVQLSSTTPTTPQTIYTKLILVYGPHKGKAIAKQAEHVKPWYNNNNNNNIFRILSLFYIGCVFVALCLHLSLF